MLSIYSLNSLLVSFIHFLFPSMIRNSMLLTIMERDVAFPGTVFQSYRNVVYSCMHSEIGPEWSESYTERITNHGV